ncbi:MAG: hypothetical protein ACI31V_05500 [Bacilli bacterium]
MKHRKLIILIVIWILLIGGIFIYSKTTKKETTEIIEPPVIETEDLSSFQYIDYKGYYDENDLETEQTYIDEENNISYLKISGLKDKKLEEKINKELYEMVTELMNNGYQHVSSRLSLNAFNILSVEVTAYDGTEQISKVLNIDLTTGENIKLNNILNIKNIKRIISEEYYDAVFTQIEKEKIYNERDINYYEYCINNNCSDIEEIKKRNEEAQIEKEELNKLIENIDEESLKFTRSINENTDFYITPFGIVLPNVKLGNTKINTQIRISIDKNPRLFNFYYKFKTDESIFDGTYEGTKNMLYVNQYSGIRKPHVKELDDYGVIYYFDREDKILETTKEIFDRYVEELDKTKFTAIFDTYELENYIVINECSMTKEIYDSTEKNRYFDYILNSNNSHIPFDTKNENITCRSVTIYKENENVMEISTIDGSDKELVIKNNPELTEKIKKQLNDVIESINKQYGFDDAYSSIKNVTEDTIEIEVYHTKKDFSNRMQGSHSFSLK